jgi:hypothetical protein
VGKLNGEMEGSGIVGSGLALAFRSPSWTTSIETMATESFNKAPHFERGLISVLSESVTELVTSAQ